MPDALDAWRDRHNRRLSDELPAFVQEQRDTGLSRMQVEVLWALRSYQPPAGGPSQPSTADLAHVVRCSARGARGALAALRAAGKLPL